MAQFKVGDRVIVPNHQNGPAGPGVVTEIDGEKKLCSVEYDTGMRTPDGVPIMKLAPHPFRESELKPHP